MPKQTQKVRFEGRSYDVIENLRIGGRRLSVLERLGNQQRPVFRVLDSGVASQMRCMHRLPQSPEVTRRLRLLTKLTSGQANLPFIVDSFTTGRDVVVLTKWIEGPTLAEYLGHCRNGKEPWPSPLIVINLMRGLAHGCRLLHERLAVAHGDLHPGNLILCRHTKRLVPIDFGSAWHLETSLTRLEGDGAAKLYAAPELLGQTASPPGFRSDQFSAMVICYELLTGKIPYDGLGGKVSLASCEEREEIKIKPPSTLLRHSGNLPKRYSDPLDELVERGLAVGASARYSTTSEWTTALDDCYRRLQGTSASSPRNQWLQRQIEKLSRLWQR